MKPKPIVRRYWFGEWYWGLFRTKSSPRPTMIARDVRSISREIDRHKQLAAAGRGGIGQRPPYYAHRG